MDERELAFAGAAQQARLLSDGTTTAPALLELYLGRIARLDRGRPSASRALFVNPWFCLRLQNEARPAI